MSFCSVWVLYHFFLDCYVVVGIRIHVGTYVPSSVQCFSDPTCPFGLLLERWLLKEEVKQQRLHKRRAIDYQREKKLDGRKPVQRWGTDGSGHETSVHFSAILGINLLECVSIIDTHDFFWRFRGVSGNVMRPLHEENAGHYHDEDLADPRSHSVSRGGSEI